MICADIVEHPLSLQVGGHDHEQLAKCAEAAFVHCVSDNAIIYVCSNGATMKLTLILVAHRIAYRLAGLVHA